MILYVVFLIMYKDKIFYFKKLKVKKKFQKNKSS